MASISFKLPFGKYKGMTLQQVFDENPGYVDWLLAQDWLYSSTKKAVIAFASKPFVDDTLTKLFEEDSEYWYDSQKQELRQKKLFVIQEQTDRFFSHGKPARIRKEYPTSEQLDLDKRPANWITRNTRWDHTKKAMVRAAYWTEVELELTIQPEEPKILKPGSAWRLTADLATQIEEAPSQEQVTLCKHPAMPLLKRFRTDIVGRKTIQGNLKKLRERFKTLPLKHTEPERPLYYETLEDRFEELLTTIRNKEARQKARQQLLMNPVFDSLREQAFTAFDPCI